MKRLIFAICVVLSAQSRAQTPKLMSGEDAARLHLLLKHPPPEYPYEARQRRVTGSGIFILHFDYDSGQVRQVDVFQSMKNPLLDSSAVVALKQWRAKPRSVHDLAIPVTFTTGGAR